MRIKGVCMKYEIVFIDIDGTLRDSNGVVRSETKSQIKKLIKHGIKVVLCTGRSRKYASKIAKEVGTSEYVISSNGSEVTNFKTKEVIASHPIDSSYVESIYDYCKQNNLNMLLNTLNEDYQTIDESNNRVLINDISSVKDKVNQIVITSNNYNRMVLIPNMFKDKYLDLIVNGSSRELKEKNFHPSKDYYHDFNTKGVTKARGVVDLLEYLNIPVNHSIAIGDSQNDISMCEIAGYCVAMGNAIDSLKRISDEVTLKNDDNGVAKFLNKLVS